MPFRKTPYSLNPIIDPGNLPYAGALLIGYAPKRWYSVPLIMPLAPGAPSAA